MPSSNDSPIAIVPFRTELRQDFERLNLAWLEEHGLLEPADLDYLQQPERHILDDGGEIYFALRDDRVLGTCAALRISSETVELAKLAVAPEAQGHGLGRRLVAQVLDFARAAGASRVVLTSHTALAAAIRLYESLGFRHEPIPPDVRYATANVYMTLELIGMPVETVPTAP